MMNSLAHSLVALLSCTLLGGSLSFGFIVYDSTEGEWKTTETTNDSQSILFTSAIPPQAEPELKTEKSFALAVFFKTNWFRAAQYCRYRGMQLASLANEKQEKDLERYIESVGFELGPTWTSGTDLSEEGVYFWASSGTPVTFTKWGEGQPSGDRDENCLYITNDSGEGFTWHDASCGNEYYFACEYFRSNFTTSRLYPLYV